MSVEDLDAESARAQIATADAQRLAVRRADLDRLSLLVVAAAQVLGSVVVVVLYSALRDFGPYLWFVPVFLILPFSAWRERHERVFSRTGKRILWTALGVCAAWWFLLVFWISPRIGWHMPKPDWHYIVIVVISVTPLLLGAWLIGRVRWE